MIQGTCAQMLKQLPSEYRTRILGECPDGGMYRLHGAFLMDCSKVLLFRQGKINSMKRHNDFNDKDDVSDQYYEFDSYRKVGYHELNNTMEWDEDYHIYY